MYKTCLHSKDEFVYMKSVVDKHKSRNGMWVFVCVCVQNVLKGVSLRPLCCLVFKEINNSVKFQVYVWCVLPKYLKTGLIGRHFLLSNEC